MTLPSIEGYAGLAAQEAEALHRRLVADAEQHRHPGGAVAMRQPGRPGDDTAMLPVEALALDLGHAAAMCDRVDIARGGAVPLGAQAGLEAHHGQPHRIERGIAEADLRRERAAGRRGCGIEPIERLSPAED